MNQTYEALFTPWKIGKVEIKNRIVLCPMGGTSLFGWMEPNHFDKEAAAFFLERARNNVGLIIPGIAPIRDTIGGRWLYQNKKMFRELKPYMEQIHATGAKLFVQLTAGMGGPGASRTRCCRCTKIPCCAHWPSPSWTPTTSWPAPARCLPAGRKTSPAPK